MQKKILLVFISIVFLTACHSDKKTKNKMQTDGTPIVIDQDISCPVQEFTSPFEIPALLQELGIPFSLKYLYPRGHFSEFDTEFKKAFGLGVLSSDFVYLNIYEKASVIANLLPAIKFLAEEIHVEQFYDFPTLARLATNNEQLDSLFYLSIHSFDEVGNYLRVHKKSDLSDFIQLGSWLEGLYLATQAVKQKRNKRIEERIIENKTLFIDLINEINCHKNGKNFSDFMSKFDKIKKTYEDVVMTPSYNSVMIKVNTTSTVKMTQKQLNAIIKATEEVQNKWTVRAALCGRP